MDIEKAIAGVLAELEHYKNHEELSLAIKQAITLSKKNITSGNAIKLLGEGWVAEEALSIALFCVLKEKDPKTALLMAINHSGDSDSTGAICGNILGAMHGMKAFPKEWIINTEIIDFIIHTADFLHSD